MSEVWLFDDGAAGLSPLTSLRASPDVRTGALTQAERARLVLGATVAGLIVPPAMAGLVSEQHGRPVNRAPAMNAVITLLNGRAPLAADLVPRLKAGVVMAEEESGSVIAAMVPGERVMPLLGGETGGLSVERLPGRHLMARPWDAIGWRNRCVARDLGLLGAGPHRDPPATCTRFGHAALVIDPAAKVYPGVTFDLEHGAIVVAEGATVRPGATLIGPVYVGPGSTVSDRALIKADTAIGPRCKVAGEVGGTIFQGHANKGHDGHLGDSWVGEWVNLGAGTMNSNLLNTYGEVLARGASGGAERTGMQFLGAILGDHVKTAIGTRIMTGCVAGTGAMWAAGRAMSGYVPPFAWVTDEGERRYRRGRFVEVARAMMARRNVAPGAEYVRRVEGMIGDEG
ncbi:MAG: hypothetical protein IT437_11600 [Phycisphaerales bacterium]|nr:hypothetical protein [Phycisphaerales bacterium]